MAAFISAAVFIVGVSFAARPAAANAGWGDVRDMAPTVSTPFPRDFILFFMPPRVRIEQVLVNKGFLSAPGEHGSRDLVIAIK